MRRTDVLFPTIWLVFVFGPGVSAMSEVVRLIERIENGEHRAADELLPLVYQQLRNLAKHHLSHERPGQSLQTADLVHEAYLRLVGTDQKWQDCRQFLAAAAEAMRRILVERARRKRRLKHGGRFARVELGDVPARLGPEPEEVIAVSDLLDSLSKLHPREAQLVKLHYFAGLSVSEAGRAIGLPSSTAHRYWNYARAWLQEAINGKGVEVRDG